MPSSNKKFLFQDEKGVSSEVILDAKVSNRYWDIIPQDGKVLPVSQPRAYYPAIAYNATPIFFDGTKLRKYVAYYGASAGAQSYCAFSDDGITWDTETLVTGVVGLGYHAVVLVISGILHYFYWDTTKLYTSDTIRHATFNPAVSCSATVSDQPLSGTYVDGTITLRRGSYGAYAIFFNSTPTNNPANPYSYAWCMIHNGTTGGVEGMLFATSPDGLNFSAYNGLTEVIPRSNISNNYLALYSSITGYNENDIVTYLNKVYKASGTGPFLNMQPDLHPEIWTDISSQMWDANVNGFASFIDSNGLWHCFYAGGLGSPSGADGNYVDGLGYATSIDGITWTKWDKNPLIKKQEARKTWNRIYTPILIQDASGYKLYYSQKSNLGIYTVGYATLNGWV